MTADRLAEIEQRVQAAPPGPWLAMDAYAGTAHDAYGMVVSDASDDPDLSVQLHPGGEADAELIAHAPADLDWTTRELRLTLAELERTRQRVRDLEDTLQKRVDTIDRAISRAAEGVARGEDTYEGLNPAEAYHEGLCDAFMYARGMH